MGSYMPGHTQEQVATIRGRLEDSGGVAMGNSAVRTDDRVSWARFAWVAPLTVVAVLVVNNLAKLVIQFLLPSMARISQLQQPLISISLEGAIAAVLVFGIVGVLVPRPIFWYRRLAVAALLISFLPDIGLGIGGETRLAVGRVMAIPLSLGAPPPPAGGGGAPTGLPPAIPLEQVLLLFALHILTAVTCVGLLTTLARRHGTHLSASREPAPSMSEAFQADGQARLS
jgi:hypothetical protein